MGNRWVGLMVGVGLLFSMTLAAASELPDPFGYAQYSARSWAPNEPRGAAPAVRDLRLKLDEKLAAARQQVLFYQRLGRKAEADVAQKALDELLRAYQQVSPANSASGTVAPDTLDVLADYDLIGRLLSGSQKDSGALTNRRKALQPLLSSGPDAGALREALRADAELLTKLLAPQEKLSAEEAAMVRARLNALLPVVDPDSVIAAALKSYRARRAQFEADIAWARAREKQFQGVSPALAQQAAAEAANLEAGLAQFEIDNRYRSDRLLDGLHTMSLEEDLHIKINREALAADLLEKGGQTAAAAATSALAARLQRRYEILHTWLLAERLLAAAAAKVVATTPPANRKAQKAQAKAVKELSKAAALSDVTARLKKIADRPDAQRLATELMAGLSTTALQRLAGIDSSAAELLDKKRKEGAQADSELKSANAAMEAADEEASAAYSAASEQYLAACGQIDLLGRSGDEHDHVLAVLMQTELGADWKAPQGPSEAKRVAWLQSKLGPGKAVLLDSLDELNKELKANPPVPSFDLYLTAVLRNPQGDAHQVVLPGYTTAAAGDRVAWQAFRPVYSPAVAKSLENSDKVRTSLAALMSDGPAAYTAQWKVVVQAVDELLKGITEDAGKKLEAASALPDTGKTLTSDQTALLKQLAQVFVALRTFAATVTAAGSDATRLGSVLMKIDSGIQAFNGALASAQSLLSNPAALDTAISQLNNVDQGLAKDVKTRIDAFVKTLGGTDVGRLLQALQDAGKSTGEVPLRLDNLLAQQIGTVDLDTVALVSHLGADERQPHAELLLSGYLAPHGQALKSGDTPHGSRRFVCEVYRPHGGPKTAQMFVWPFHHAASKTSGNPITTYGYSVHPNSSWFANPAVVGTLSATHFREGKLGDMGLGVGVTAFDDKIWLGYGFDMWGSHRSYWNVSVDLPAIWNLIPQFGVGK